jgi:putative transposase
MTKKYIKNFSAEYKTKVVLELLESAVTISQLSKKYQITPKTIQNWKKQFLSNASMAFEPAKVVSEYKTEIEELKSQNDELAKALGKATVERDWALGKLRGLDIANKRDLVDSKLEDLSMARQCELLKINRSMLYYQPKIMSLYNKKIMDRIDEIWLSRTYWGVVISLYMGYSGVDKYIIYNNRHQNVQFYTLFRYRFFKNNSSNH